MVGDDRKHTNAIVGRTGAGGGVGGGVEGCKVILSPIIKSSRVFSCD